MQELFASPYMRVNTSTDVVGVEICGALKNVLAIAAGIVEVCLIVANVDLNSNACVTAASIDTSHLTTIKGLVTSDSIASFQRETDLPPDQP